MPVHIIQQESGNLCIMRATGVLKKSELERCQGSLGAKIDAGGKPCVLIRLEDFEGWERGVDWDLDFLITKGDQIAKIAIVGDPQWESEALLFAGAGIRPTPVKYFPTEQSAEASAWLAE